MEKIKEVIAEHMREVIIGGMATLLVVIAMVMMFSGTQTSEANMPQTAESLTSQSFSGDPTQTSASQSVSQDTRSIYVDVKGAVHHPGLKKMSGDMRIIDVVQEAGGFTKDADQRQVNLAQRVSDQQVVFIPRHGQEAPQGTTGTMGAGGEGPNAASGQAPEVDLNNADANELQQLDGIGEKKAEKIIAYREQNGQFKSVDDLKNVSGFGDKTVARLKPQLRV